MDKTNGYSFADSEPLKDKKMFPMILKIAHTALFFIVINFFIVVWGGLMLNSLLDLSLFITFAISITAGLVFNGFAIRYTRRNWHDPNFMKPDLDTPSTNRSRASWLSRQENFQSMVTSRRYAGVKGNIRNS